MRCIARVNACSKTFLWFKNRMVGSALWTEAYSEKELSMEVSV
jgi:hypothetical protein